jgi:hypothetical protein
VLPQGRVKPTQRRKLEPKKGGDPSSILGIQLLTLTLVTEARPPPTAMAMEVAATVSGAARGGGPRGRCG